MEDYKIDFVIPWVDGGDPAWLDAKEQCCIAEGNTAFSGKKQASRYRDWNTLKYWFRGVEKFTPWVNHIYFVTWGHVPEWLDTTNPKLTIVRHEDYIPNEYLPVFSANPIEINFHRIEGLSEHFVYFNDDMFVIDNMKKEDFFVDGLPREMACMYMLTNTGGDETFMDMLFHMQRQVNNNFDMHTCINNNRNKWFNIKYGKMLINNFLLYRYNVMSGLIMPHVPSSLTKSMMNEVWNTLKPQMEETCKHRFRNSKDMTQYIFRFWAIAKGKFYPTNVFRYSKEFYGADIHISKIKETIEKQKTKLLCINDTVNLNVFEDIRDSIVCSFETILGDKSSFEK